MKVDLEHVLSFSAVAAELSFSRAAERLHADQSRISRQVRQLEERLGQPLFVRTTRHVEMTPVGHALYQAAQSVAAAAVGFEAALDKVHSQGAPVKRIGLLFTRMVPLRAALLEAARRRFPGITLIVDYALSPKLIQQLRDGELDMIIAHEPFDRVGFDALLCERTPLSAILALDDPLAALPAVPLAALDRHDVRFVCPHLDVTMARRINAAIGGGRERIEPRPEPMSFCFTPPSTMAQLTFAVPPEVETMRETFAVRPVSDAGFVRDCFLIRRLDQRDPVLDWFFAEAARLRDATAAKRPRGAFD